MDVEMASTGTFGRHVIAELKGASFQALNNALELTNLLLEASEKAGATVEGFHTKVFEPQGCSVNITLSESHVAVHTFPECNYASFDAYTCGLLADPYDILQYVLDRIGGEAEYEIKHRGILDQKSSMQTADNGYGILKSKKKFVIPEGTKHAWEYL
jgi:S-adenosylmethionine decarboxylase